MIDIKDKQNTLWVCGNRNMYMIQYNPCYVLYNPFADIAGENINHLNRFWSEFVCQYYVRKNNLKSQVITFCHDTRIVKASKVHTQRINTEKSIEYYFLVYTNMRRSHDKLGNRLGFDTITGDDLNFRNFYYEIVSKMGQPKFMFDLFANYLRKQKIVPLESIINQANDLDYSFVTREIFSCNWKTFLEMTDFTIEYFDYIQNELNLSYDLEKHKQFFIKEIFPHYIELNKNVNMTYSKYLYQSTEDFNKISRPDLDYGFVGRNNVFRLFSYHIEILISIFIRSKIHFLGDEGSIY